MSLSSKNFQQIKASCTFFIAHINRIQNILNRKKGHNMPNISFLFFFFPYSSNVIPQLTKIPLGSFFCWTLFAHLVWMMMMLVQKVYRHKSWICWQVVIKKKYLKTSLKSFWTTDFMTKVFINNNAYVFQLPLFA